MRIQSADLDPAPRKACEGFTLDTACVQELRGLGSAVLQVSQTSHTEKLEVKPCM